MGFAERLKQSAGNAGLSIRELHRRLSGLPGSSYPSIHRYLRGRAEPPAGFVTGAANVLGVLPGWLLTGDGPRTAEETAVEEQRRLDESGDPDRPHLLYVRELDLGDDGHAESRRRALLRFSRKLEDASLLPVLSSVSREGERAALMASAGSFLVKVERSFQEAASTPIGLPTELDPRPLVARRILLGESSSTGWRVIWHDAILDLFALRVFGLGERSGRLSDAHHPVFPDLSTREDRREAQKVLRDQLNRGGQESPGDSPAPPERSTAGKQKAKRARKH